MSAVTLEREKLAYNVQEAIRATGLGRTTLYDMIKKGELVSVKVRGRTLIPADSLRSAIGLRDAA